MKKLLFVLAIGAFAACGESGTENESTVDSASTSTVDSSTVAPSTTDTTATMPADSSATHTDSAASK